MTSTTIWEDNHKVYMICDSTENRRKTKFCLQMVQQTLKNTCAPTVDIHG